MKHSPARERKVKRVRYKIASLNVLRLTVNKTPKHIYAQLFTPDGAKVLASASSVDKEVRKSIAKDKVDKCGVAKIVGEFLAKRVKEQGIDKVAFDRSGNRFHGRIKALAEAVRENGVHC